MDKNIVAEDQICTTYVVMARRSTVAF